MKPLLSPMQERPAQTGSELPQIPALGIKSRLEFVIDRKGGDAGGRVEVVVVMGGQVWLFVM